MSDRSITKCAGHLIQLALREDIGAGDITTGAVVPPCAVARAKITAKQDMIVAGINVAARVFKTVDKKIKVEIKIRDGEKAEKGEVIAIISGPARSILTAERTALNFLQHFSGIATTTRKFVDAVRGTGVKILDTRKTTPGWRELEKYAVRLGGGVNHRMGLYDRYLVKGNHVRVAGSIRKAIAQIKAKSPSPQPSPLKGEGVPLEVETKNLKDVAEALAGGADIIMLDNFTVADARRAVKIVTAPHPLPSPLGGEGRVRGRIFRPQLEISGNITLDNIRKFAKTGVDFISVGSITHSAPAADIHMTVTVINPRGW